MKWHLNPELLPKINIIKLLANQINSSSKEGFNLICQPNIKSTEMEAVSFTLHVSPEETYQHATYLKYQTKNLRDHKHF